MPVDPRSGLAVNPSTPRPCARAASMTAVSAAARSAGPLDQTRAAQAASADLELRLHQEHEVAGRRKQADEVSHHRRERDEGQVDDHEVCRPPDLWRTQAPDRGAAELEDPRVIGDLRDELVMPDIDSHHRCCPSSEKGLAEPSGGGADIDTPTASDAESVGSPPPQGVVELAAPAADPPRPFVLDRENDRVADRLRRLGGDATVDDDLACCHEVARITPGPGETASHELRVEPGDLSRRDR